MTVPRPNSSSIRLLPRRWQRPRQRRPRRGPLAGGLALILLAATPARAGEPVAAQPQSAPAQPGPAPAAAVPDEARLDRHLLRARELLQGHVYLEASRELELHVKAYPEDVEGRALLADTLYQLGDFRRAASQYAEVVRLQPDYPEARSQLQECLSEWERALDANDPVEIVELARALNQAGRATQMSTAYEQALQLKPDPEVRLEYAQALSWNKRYEESAQQFERYLTERPDDAAAQLMLAETFSYAARYTEAAGVLRSYLERRPLDSAARLKLAQNLGWANDLESAAAEVEKVVAADPGNVDALFLAGQLQEWQGNLTEAIKTYTRVLELAPTHVEAATQLDKLRRSPLVLVQTHRDWLRQHPEDTEVRRQLVEALIAAQLYSEAVDEVDRLLIDVPEDPAVRALRERAVAARREAVTERIARARALLASRPDDPEVLRTLADDLAALQEYGDAADLYARYLTLQPTDQDARLKAARYASWAQRYEYSLELYREYVTAKPDDLAARIEMARVLTWSGQSEEAERELRAILRDRPQSLPALLQLGQVYEYLGDLAKARAHYQQALAIDPSSQEVLLAIARVDRTEKEQQAAQTVAGLESMLLLEPESLSLRLSLARRLAADRMWERSATEYRRVLEARPDDSAVRVEYARLLSWMRDYPSAIQEYQRYLEAAPQDHAARLELASVHITLKDLAAAMAELNQVVAQNPAHIEARWMRASIFQWAELWDEAVAEYQLIYEIDPRYEVALEKIKEIEISSPYFVRQYQRAVELDPDDLQARYRYALLLLQREEYSLAVQEFEELKRRGIRDAQIDQLLAAARLRQRNMAQMEIRRVRELLLEDPQNDQAELQLARARSQAGQTSQALVHYERYLERNPGDFQVRKEYADVLSWSGRYSQAIQNYRLVLAADPDNRDVHRQLVRVMSWNRGSLPIAVQTMQQWVREQPSDPDLRVALGDLYRYYGKEASAIRQYNEALDLDPTSEPAVEGIELARTQLRPKINPGGLYLRDNFSDFTRIDGYVRGQLHSQDGQWLFQPQYTFHWFQQDELRPIEPGQPGEPDPPDVMGHEIGAQVRSEFSDRLEGDLYGALIPYDEDVGTSGRLIAKLGYWVRPSLFLAGGYRHQDAVYEVNTLDSLLDGRIESDDFIAEIRGRTYSSNLDSPLNRFHGSGEFAYGDFTDGNQRMRAAASVLYDLQYNPTVSIGYGFRFFGFDEERPQYYSPDGYTEHGIILPVEQDFTRWSYRLEGGIFRAVEAGDWVYSILGRLYYNFTDNFSAGIVAAHATTSPEDPEIDEFSTTSFLLDLMYRF